MKVVWVDFKGCHDYDKEKHSQMADIFLFWSDGDCLLVGGHDFVNHEGIYNAAKDFIPATTPDGAGQIFFEEIKYWDSVWFNITTPVQLRPMIAEEIGLKDCS